ncbi:6781_t:CDS:2, partial [Scutellospora calospora]
MYTLLSGFHKYLTRREEFYIVILGLDNAGKTTLLERIKSIFLGIMGLSPDRIAPTVGLNRQRELHGIWEKYYSECHAIIFVVDSTDKERIEECKEIFERIITNEEVEGVPVLMLANKQDLPNSLKVEEIKEIFNKIALKLGARDSRVLPISALGG